MNARAKLMRRLGYSLPLGVAEMLVNNFAHELAEEIRARAERIVGVGPYSLGIMAVLNEALESIDPKEKK